MKFHFLSSSDTLCTCLFPEHQNPQPQTFCGTAYPGVFQGLSPCPSHPPPAVFIVCMLRQRAIPRRPEGTGLKRDGEKHQSRTNRCRRCSNRCLTPFPHPHDPRTPSIPARTAHGIARQLLSSTPRCPRLPFGRRDGRHRARTAVSGGPAGPPGRGCQQSLTQRRSTNT